MHNRTATALSLACCLLLVLAGCKTDTPDTANPAAEPAPVQAATCGSIKTLHQTGGAMYFASQPSAEDYALVKAMGIKTVIDLRTEQENRGFDEAKTVSDLGMAYVSIPWNSPEQLTDEKLDAMRAALRSAQRPLMMKCGSSNRVGAGWLAYRVLDEGVSVETAIAEAKEVGLRTPAYEAKALAYIETHR